MIGDKIKKLKLAPQDSKVRLAQLLVDGRTDNGNVKVVADGNKQIRQILISQELFDKGDKEAVEESVQIAVNRALENAKEIYKEEMLEIEKDVNPKNTGINR